MKRFGPLVLMFLFLTCAHIPHQPAQNGQVFTYRSKTAEKVSIAGNDTTFTLRK